MGRVAIWMHRLAHRFGWNTGRVTTYWDRADVLRVCFVCSGCGQVSGDAQASVPPYQKWRGVNGYADDVSWPE